MMLLVAVGLSLIKNYWWNRAPGIESCLCFWALAAVGMLRLLPSVRGVERRVAYWGVLLGAVMNAAVTLTNSGRMPVLGIHSGDPALYGHYVAARSSHHLLWLADRIYWWSGASPGDFVVECSVVLALALWGCKKITRKINDARRTQQDPAAA